MSSSSLPERERARTARHLNLPGFSLSDQAALFHAHVLIVGAGGLGCPILQQLAAAGVGEITLIDDDTVDLTNIHRQILFGADDVGRPKVDVAAERARALQPDLTIYPVRDRLTTDNAVDYVGKCDLVLDGSDTFATKYLVADAAEITGTPLVWGTVLRFHGDVALWHSGAASRGVGLRDVFPQQPGADSVPDCATAGVLGVTTSVIGGLMSTLAIGHITGRDSQPGRITSYDAFPATMRTVQASADPERTPVTQLEGYYGESCAAPGAGAGSGAGAKSFDAADHGPLQLVRDGEAVLVDIREPHEHFLADFPAELNPRRLPLSSIRSLGDVAEALAGADRAVIACAAGVRSANFISEFGEFAAAHGCELIDLPGGIHGLE